MSNKSQTNSKEKPLPIKLFFIVLAVVLSLVSIIAAIAGENSKLNTQAGRFVMYSVSGYYDKAETLLTDNAKTNIPRGTLHSKLAALRLHMVDKYGVNLEEEYKARADSEIWIPWIGDNRKIVSVGFYKAGTTPKSMIKEYLNPPSLEGKKLEGLLTLVRVDGRWKVDALNFSEGEFLEGIKQAPGKSYLTLSEDGFVLQGMVFSKEQKLDEKEIEEMRKALHAAIRELDRDRKSEDSSDLMKMFK